MGFFTIYLTSRIKSSLEHTPQKNVGIWQGVTDEDNLMRLFEIYAKTGSDVAREKLMERGLLAVPTDPKVAKNSQ